MTNTTTESNWEKTRLVWLIRTRHSASLRKSKAGNQAETVEGCSPTWELLQPGSYAQEGAVHSELGSFTSLRHSALSGQACPQTNLIEAITQLRCFPGDPRLCRIDSWSPLGQDHVAEKQLSSDPLNLYSLSTAWRSRERATSIIGDDPGSSDPSTSASGIVHP